MAKAEKSDKGLAARVSRVEAAVKQLTQEMPARPEDVVARQAMQQGGPDQFLRENPAGRNQDVGVSDRLAAMGGRSRSDVVPDAERGSSSPLGHGKTKRSR